MTVRVTKTAAAEQRRLVASHWAGYVGAVALCQRAEADRAAGRAVSHGTVQAMIGRNNFARWYQRASEKLAKMRVA